MGQLKMLEDYTRRIISMHIGLRDHDLYCQTFDLVREIYNRGSRDGFSECKQTIVMEVLQKR